MKLFTSNAFVIAAVCLLSTDSAFALPKGKKGGKGGKKEAGVRTCATFSADQTVACCRSANPEQCSKILTDNGGTVGEVKTIRKTLDESGKNVCGKGPEEGTKVCCQQGSAFCEKFLPGKKPKDKKKKGKKGKKEKN